MSEPPMSGRRLSVLVADDSALFRQLLLNVFRQIPGAEVVGTARDGVEAVDMVSALRPDVVTLDVQMPRLDGLGVLRELRRRGIRPRVIMVSSLTGDGSPATIDALMEGAFDFLEKPAGLEAHEIRAWIRRHLLEKLAAIADARVAIPGQSARRPVGEGPAGGFPGSPPFDLVAIGTSTGGPAALTAIVPALPADLPVPVLIVQHMPPGFTAALAARLAGISPARVAEAADGTELAAGAILVAPGGMHLRVARRGGDRLACVVEAGPHRLGCRPSFDALLESLALLDGVRTLAVVLTGIGRDGVEGCVAVRRAGGRVLAQAREGCVVYGMPKAVADAGLADAVLPLGEIAGAIAGVVGRIRA